LRELILDCAGWTNEEAAYDSFFGAVGAPIWHGRNFNALNDSIYTGQINEIEVPYRLVLRNFDKMSPHVKPFAANFIDLIHELESKGSPVAIRLD